MQILWCQHSVCTPLNVLGATACLFLTVRGESPTPLPLSSLSLAWSSSSLLLAMLCYPIRSTAPTQLARDWLAGLWCCCLSLRSSLDCSDRFFNESRTAVVLQHLWLSIWHFLVLHFTKRSHIFSFSESIDRSHCSCLIGISQHISLAFCHPFIHDPSCLICPSFVFQTFFRPHFPKKGGNSEHCVAKRWVHLIRV